MASTVVAAVATATRSNTSSPTPVINKSVVDSQGHPRTSSTGTALQMSAAETTDGRVFATDLNQKYAIHTIVEYTNALVPDMVSISNAPYYWGRMDRYEAEQLLEGRPEGTFLLRDSAQINYLFSISFRRYKRTLHARIEHLNGMFSFDITDKSVFSAPKITDVVANYKDPSKCLFFEPLLSIPMCRGFTFSLQHLCRSTIASHCDYASVADLPLPAQLKKFVREYHYKQPVRVTDQE
uniref:Suppressor of cytokine signaling 5 n=1 Tax=Ditylenchus dipsaci TaxID=166011 RepID=A0A915CPW0_9BILA